MEEERIDNLALKINMLLVFCNELLPDIDLLEKAYKEAQNKHSYTDSAAPILTSLGLDYEKIKIEWYIRERRSKALINLLKVIEETEKERTQYFKMEIEKQEARMQLQKILNA